MYSLPQSYNQTSKCKRCISSNAYDVNKYISWINNLLIYEEEPLPMVLKRLELYYGKKFIIKNNISDIQISGKLELKNSLSKVLHTLSYSFPIDFEEKEDSIWVMTRNN